VGDLPASCPSFDSRVFWEPVEPLFGPYFYGNKLHLCDTDAERAVFLDSDTVVLRPLQDLWRFRPQALLARPGAAMAMPNWNRETWRGLCETIGARPVPMFNAGLLVFQGNSHRKLKRTWETLLLRFLSGDFPHPNPDKRMFEQWSLALAVAHDQITFAELDSKSHAFGWLRESQVDATVFHFGNRLFRELHQSAISKRSKNQSSS
jgi:hypothetical protein